MIKQVIVRQYGLLDPLNWDRDCAEHLYLQHKFWNRLVEIERDHRTAYRAIVDADEAVSVAHQQIEDIKQAIADQDALRKAARKEHRAKKGEHTKPFDDRIAELKKQIRDLSPQAKELRNKAREKAKEALSELEPVRKEAVKKAYQESGLWWSNYNRVIDSYNVARVRAMKTGADLRFHRFDGSGVFRCQVQGGMTTEELLAGRHNIAQLRLIDHDEFAHLRGGQAGKCRQSFGSRNYERGYGVLSITVYTDKDAEGKHRRRMLDFPIILHRPLPPEATLKELKVVRKRIGTDFRWDATFTFTEEVEPVGHALPESRCGVNLGWKAVKGGLRVATIFDGLNPPRHIVLPRVIMVKLLYVQDLQGRIDTAANENFAWLLARLDEAGEEPPESLAKAFAALKRIKKPHPREFAKTVLMWKDFPDYLPGLYAEAEKRRQDCRRLEQECSNLRDKVGRRREDFYRCRAKEIAETYAQIALDKMDLQQLAALENEQGEATELTQKARFQRTVAAVSVLREWIVKQSVKTGASVDSFSLASSEICHKCGDKVQARSASSVRTCLSCGASWDEDSNAAINLYRALENGQGARS